MLARPADARSIYRPRRLRPGLAQEFELDQQAGELLLEFDEGAGGGGIGPRICPESGIPANAAGRTERYPYCYPNEKET